MGKYFGDVVDNAIEAIYYTYDQERAASVLQPLADAANAGDGDAAYILSRCTSGPQYSWDYHPFQPDDDTTEQLIRQSILFSLRRALFFIKLTGLFLCFFNRSRMYICHWSHAQRDCKYPTYYTPLTFFHTTHLIIYIF